MFGLFPGFTCLRKQGVPWTPLTCDGELRMLVRPESDKYETEARLALETGTGLFGSITDESPEANHLRIADANRPTRDATGAFTTAVNKWLYSTTTMGDAYAGDFLVGLAVRLDAYDASGRYLDMGSINGHILGQQNNSGLPNKVNSIVADVIGPYGLEVTATDGDLHCIVDSRVGTTHTLTIDEVVAGSETVPGTPLPDAYLCLNAATTAGTYGSRAKYGELFVIKDPSERDLAGAVAYLAARRTAGVYP